MKLTAKHISLKFLAAVALGLPALTLSGCMGTSQSFGPVGQQNTIQIAETVERLELYARPDGFSLSARDKMAVSQFLQGYGQQGNGPLHMSVPNVGRSHAGISQTQGFIRSTLSEMGIPSMGMKTQQYAAMQGRPAPVVISYKRLKIMERDCGHVGNMMTSYDNRPWSGFGCSNSANLAAMIQDPRQLLEPYGTTPPDMQRRMVVYDKFIEGENPASAQPDRQDISADED